MDNLALVVVLAGLALWAALYLWARQRRAAQPMLEAEAQLSMAGPAQSAHGVLVANTSGLLLFADDAARRMLGLSFSDAPHLELAAQQAHPQENFLALFAQATEVSFRAPGGWLNGVSQRVPSENGVLRTVVLLSPLQVGAQVGQEPGNVDITEVLAALDALYRVATPEASVEQTAQAVVGVLGQRLALDGAELALWDAATGQLVQRGWVGDTTYALALAEHGGGYALGEGMPGVAAQRRAPLRVASLTAPDAVARLLPSDPFDSVISVPLARPDGALLGTLSAFRRAESGAFGPGALALLEALAGPVANVLVGAQQVSDQSTRVAAMASLQQVAVDVAAAEEVYGALGARVVSLLDAEAAGVLAYDPRQNALVPRLPFVGLPGALVRTYRLSLTPGSAGATWWAADDTLIANTPDDPRLAALGFEGLVAAGGLRNVALMVLRTGAQPVGALVVANKRAGFTQADVQILRVIGAQVSVVVSGVLLAQRSRRQETELAGLQELTFAIGALGFQDDAAFFQDVTTRIANLMQLDVCGVLLYQADPTPQLVAQHPFHGLPSALVASYTIPLGPRDPLTDVWNTQETWAISAGLSNVRFYDAGLGELVEQAGVTKTLFAVMSVGGRKIGALQAAYTTGQADFGEGENRLLLIFATQVASTWENARLVREVRRRADDAESLRRVAELAGDALGGQETLLPLLREVALLADSEVVYLATRAEQPDVLTVLSGCVVGATVPAGMTLTIPSSHGAASYDRQPVVLGQARTDAAPGTPYAEVVRTLDVVRLLAVPLVLGEQVLGELGIGNPRHGDYTPDRVLQAEAVAAQLASALERLRLQDETASNLAGRLRELDAVSHVTEVLTQTLDLATVLDAIVTNGAEAAGADGGTALVLGGAYQQGTTPQLAMRVGGQILFEGVAAVEEAALNAPQDVLLVADYADAPWPPTPPQARSAIVVPFTYLGDVLGALHFWARRPAAFDARASAFVLTMAAKAALGYGNDTRYRAQVRQSEALRQRLEQLSQISELGQMLQGNIEPEAMLEAIAFSVSQSVGFDAVVIAMADEADGVLRRVTQAGLPLEAFARSQVLTLPLAEVGTLLQDEQRVGESYFYPVEKIGQWYRDGMDVLSAAHATKRSINTQGEAAWRDGDMLLVPVVGSNGDLLGIMSLDRPYDNRRPDEAKLDVLEIFAHQAATTVENNRLYRASVRAAQDAASRADQLTALAEASSQITAALQRDQVVALALQAMPRVLPHDVMLVWRLQDDHWTLEGWRGWQPADDVRPARVPTAADARLVALTTNRRAHAVSLSAPTLPGDDGMARWLGVPLLAQGALSGALTLASRHQDAFPPADEGPALAFANQVAVALANTAFYDDVMARTERLGLLNRVSLLLVQSLDMENILEVALSEIYGALRAERGRAFMLEGHYARAVVDRPRGMMIPGDMAPVEDSPTLRAMVRDGRPLLFSATAPNDPLPREVQQDLDARGVQGYLLLPMLAAGQVVGAFELESTQPNGLVLSADTLEVCLIIVNQASVAIQNASQMEQTSARTRELETLLEASQAASLTLDLHDVFSCVTGLMISALGMDDCSILLWDELRGDLEVQTDVNRNNASGRQLPRGTRLPLDQYPARLAALRQRETIVVYSDDPQADAHERAELSAQGDTLRLLVPLVVRDQATGLVILEARAPGRRLIGQELRLARALGAQVAIAIDNARLSTETSRQMEELFLVNDLARAISSTVDITRMLDVVQDTLPLLTRADTLYLALWDGDGGQITFPLVLDDGKRVERPPQPLSDDEVSFVIRNRRPLTLGGDYFSPEDVRQSLQIRNGEGDVRSYLGVPLVAGDAVLGALAVMDHTQTRAFGLNDQRKLTTIGTQLGIAVQNARLFARIQRFADDLNVQVAARTEELAQERDRLDTLYQITSELSRTLEADAVLSRALQMMATAVRADDGVILLIDPRTDNVYLRASLRPGEVQEAAYQHLTLPLALHMLEGDHPELLLSDLSDNPAWAELTSARGYRSVLGVALESNADVLGVLLLFHRQAGAFNEPQLRLVIAAANQVASAINNADLYQLIREQADRLGQLLRAEQEQAEKSASILEGIADGVILTDADGAISLFNSAAERMLVLQRADALGQRLSRLARTGRAPVIAWAQPLAALVTQERAAEASTQPPIRLDVGSRVLSVNVAPVFIGEGAGASFLGTVAVLRDITREAELDRLKGEFIANVSHELRTPMTSIKGYADLLMMGAVGETPAGHMRYLATIKSNADRLAVLVDDLLNISRLDSGRETLHLERVDLAEVAAFQLAGAQSRNFEKGIVSTFVADSGVPAVQADRHKLMQVVSNVVDNAFNYTPAGGTVTLHLAHDLARPDHVLLSVRDTGVGIPEAQRDRVWDRFARVEATALALEVPGTGLGLTIARDLVAMHGGRIWFESEEGHGTTFYISLPVQQSVPSPAPGD